MLSSGIDFKKYNRQGVLISWILSHVIEEGLYWESFFKKPFKVKFSLLVYSVLIITFKIEN